MFLGIRKKYWLYLAASAVLIGLVFFAHISPVFAWRETQTSGPGSERLGAALADYPDIGANLFSFDKDVLISHCLMAREIGNLTISLNLPDGIRAEANKFDPVVLLLDDSLLAMDGRCRIIPFDPAWSEIDLPVFTGLSIGSLFEIPNDYRVIDAIAALLEIRDECPDLYRKIAEMDFSDKIEIRIYLTTSRAEFVAAGGGFASQLKKLLATGGLEDRRDGGRYNLQYDGVVIKER